MNEWIMVMMKRWEMIGLARENLQLVERPVPQAAPGEVVVKVSAVALNFRDRLIIDGKMPTPLQFPFTPGSDLAGTVVAVGTGVTTWQQGDRVISTFSPGWLDGRPLGNAVEPPYKSLGGYYPGVLAEYVGFPADWFVRAPASLSSIEAATLPCAGLTAWFALVERGHLRAGEIVLIEGTGGVSLFALQIAKAHGAQVIVVTSSDEKMQLVRQLGADLALDRNAGDWVTALHDYSAQHGADHIVEVVGGDHLRKAIAAAAVNGQIHQIGVMAGMEITAPVTMLMMKNLTLQGIGVGHRRALQDLIRAVDVNKIKPIVDKVFPMHELDLALQHLDRGAVGKLVITMETE